LWRFTMDGFKKIVNWISDLIMAHTRIIMPVVLLVCVLITVVIAINARDRVAAERALPVEEEQELEDIELPDYIIIPELPLELNKYPEVTALMKEYYQAKVDGDGARAVELCIDLGEINIIKIEEAARYIERNEKIEVYTKDGLTAGSFVVYVARWMKFYDSDAIIPGIQAYYVEPDDEGNLFIRTVIESLEENVFNYLITVSLQDNVVDLYNKINVEFNDLIATDRDLEEFIAFTLARVDVNIGTVLAQMIQPDIDIEQLNNDNENNNDNNGTEVHQASNVTVLARATAVVNIRSSDSENAERVGRAIVGEEFTVLEQKGNGWSRIRYENRDAFIKSEFLEVISEIGGSVADAVIAGRVRVKSANVRVRSTASTSGSVLGTVNTNDRFDFIETVSGWAKVVYNNQIGYIRNDFVDIELN